MSRQYSKIQVCNLFLPERYNLNIHHSPILYIYNEYSGEVLGVYSFDRKRRILYVSHLSLHNYFRYLSTYELENSGWEFVDKKMAKVIHKIEDSLPEDLPF